MGGLALPSTVETQKTPILRGSLLALLDDRHRLGVSLVLQKRGPSACPPNSELTQILFVG